MAILGQEVPDALPHGRRPGRRHRGEPAVLPALHRPATPCRCWPRPAASTRSRVDEVLELVGLRDRAKDRVKTYSLGMKQRLAVASALLKNPKLLILDEPANGLDPGGIREMRTLMRDLADSGMTVVLSSHILGEIQLICDSVTIISAGPPGRRRPGRRRCSPSTPRRRCGSASEAVADLADRAPRCSTAAGARVVREPDHLMVSGVDKPAHDHPAARRPAALRQRAGPGRGRPGERLPGAHRHRAGRGSAPSGRPVRRCRPPRPRRRTGGWGSMSLYRQRPGGWLKRRFIRYLVIGCRARSWPPSPPACSSPTTSVGPAQIAQAQAAGGARVPGALTRTADAGQGPLRAGQAAGTADEGPVAGRTAPRSTPRSGRTSRPSGTCRRRSTSGSEFGDMITTFAAIAGAGRPS